MSILLTSILIGNGYDAYCVYGYASKAVTTKDTSLMDLPDWLKEQRDLNFNVRSWVDLSNKDDNIDNENDQDRKKYLEAFVIEEKKD